MAPYTAMASRKSIQKSCLELLADVALFSTLMKKIGFLLSGVYAGIICGGNSGSAAQQVIEAHWTPSDNFACPRCDCDKCVGVSNLAGS